MQTISCELCNMKFKTEKYLKAHLKSKRHLMWSETKPTKLHKCHCGKVFSHRQSLYLHKKSCTDTSVDARASMEPPWQKGKEKAPRDQKGNGKTALLASREENQAGNSG